MTKHHGRRLYRGLGAAAILPALAMTACGGSSSASGSSPAASSGPPKHVKFAIAVAVPDPGQVYVFSPQGWGFFKQEGLEVEVVTNAGGGAALQQVAAGNADFAISSPENFINGVAAGMGITAYATIITHSIYSVGVVNDSSIKDYAALKGKKIGISAFTSGAYPFAQAALSEHGLDPKKDVTFVITGSGGPAADALKTGKVDVVVTTDTQWAIFKTLGVGYRFLTAPAAAKLPADQIITRNDILKNSPDVAIRFARAAMEGVVAAHANPSKAIDYYIQQYPDAAAANNKSVNQSIMQARLDNMKLVPEQNNKWGYIPVQLYQEVQQAGVTYAIIKTPQDLTKLMTNDLVGKFDSFDVAKVQQQAKNTR